MQGTDCLTVAVRLRAPVPLLARGATIRAKGPSQSSPARQQGDQYFTASHGRGSAPFPNRERKRLVRSHRAALQGIIDGGLGNLEFRDRRVPHIPDIFNPNGTGVVSIHHHLARPIEKFNTWPKLWRLVLAVSD